MSKIYCEYGKFQVNIRVPDSAEILSSGHAAPVKNFADEIYRSLKKPIGTQSLNNLARGCTQAAIVISDNTRPVPYKGPNNILTPLIQLLKEEGIKQIKLIVAYGTHRPLSEQKLKEMLDPTVFQPGVEVIHHRATDKSMIRHIGRTERTPEVTVNRHYLDANLKILTGLVEPHFMAGFSGGRKSVCPGICGESVTYGFHSASMLNTKESTSLVLKKNPCHEESLRIARMAGVDFIMNVTLDNSKKITGIFAGELEIAHLKAVKHLCSYVKIPIKKLYDIVIIPAGHVGINHYQCAKAAMEASRAVKPGGSIILLANLTDTEFIGRQNYKNLLKLLGKIGTVAFRQKLLSKEWSFVPDQWQAQMWIKVFERLGSAKKLYTCAPKLVDCQEKLLPETNVANQIKPLPKENERSFAERMVQLKIDQLVNQDIEQKILVLPDGSYGVPIYKHPSF